MTRDMVNRISGLAPVLMSLAAFLIVVAVVTTGWERTLADEGVAAHLFQILIALQVPIIAGFLITARPSRVRNIAGPMALQAAALVLAFGSLAYFRL